MLNHKSELEKIRSRFQKQDADLEHKILDETLQLQTIYQRLQTSERRLAGILNVLQDIIWSASITPFEILYLNPAVTHIFQRSPQEFLLNSQLWFDIIHHEDRPEVMESLQTILIRGSMDIEYRIFCPNGEIRWVKNRCYVVIDNHDDHQTVSTRVEGIITDITDRKRAESQLMHNALHDGLTQLPNRTLFCDRLENALQKKRRIPTYNFAVLFLDLDRFKVVNDSLGHVVGDGLLVEVANRLKSAIRPGDTVARLGGDEFTILLDDILSTADTLSCVHRIQEVLKPPFWVDDNQIFMGASIGIVIATENYTTATELLRDADIAMYRAKENRQASYELFNKAMHGQTLHRLKLENDLRLAIDRQEFELNYQPIFKLETEQLLGFEALIRWNHPEQGMIPPNDFIGIAEETGLILELGEWILKAACHQVKQWQEQFPVYRNLMININVSEQQFRDSNFLPSLDNTLTETGIAGSSIHLEITEGTLIQDVETVIKTLNKIRDRKIRISIDDFGTGYSSLSYLTRLPINNLKIDQSFVGRMHLDRDNVEIVRTITSLAHSLGMDVTAEGIESKEHLKLLKEFHCELGQGYFFSKPLTAIAATQRLAMASAAKTIPRNK